MPDILPTDLLAEHDWLRRLARSLVAGRDLADDAVQETWLRVLRAAPEAGALQRPRAWLRTVLENVVRRWQRGEQRRLRRHARMPIREHEPPVDEAVARAETWQRVATALLALSEPYRTVLVLRYHAGLGIDALAQQVGAPKETVRTQLQRGLRLLRTRLDDEHGGDRAAWAGPLLMLVGAGALPVGAVVALAAAVLMLAGWFVFGSLAPVAAPAPELRREAAAASGPRLPAAASERVDEPAEEARQLAVDVPADERVAAAQSPVADAPPAAAATHDLLLVRGRVVDERTALPLLGAEVTCEASLVQFRSWSGAEVEREAPPVARVGANGEFEFQVPRSSAQVLVVRAAGYAGHKRSLWQYSPTGDGVSADVGDVALAAVGTLHGGVIEVGGEPAVAADVFLLCVDGSFLAWESIGRTDAAGHFAGTVPRWQGTLWLLAVRGPDVAVAKVPPDGSRVELRMRPRAHLVVDVVDDAGTPIRGAQAFAHPAGLPDDDGRMRLAAGRGPRLGGHADTGGDGRAVLGELPIAAPAGECLLYVCADGHRGERRRQPLQVGANVVRVVLPRGPMATVRVVVVDAATGAPIPHAKIGGRAVDASGRFTCEENLEDGDVLLLVEAAGYLPRDVREPVAGRSGDLDVRIELTAAPR
jgi:RNA polymerase sigma-70 factor (ECF subfamily)